VKGDGGELNGMVSLEEEKRTLISNNKQTSK